MKLIKEMKQKTFFEEVKYFNQLQAALPTNCKDSENNVISQIEHISKHGKTFFYNILNLKET